MKLLKRSERGQALVEFTIVIIFLVIFLLGIVNMGILFSAYGEAALSAGNAAKEAALHINDGFSSCYDRAEVGAGHPNLFAMKNIAFSVSANCTDVITDPAPLSDSIITATWEFDFHSVMPFVSINRHFSVTREAYVH